MDAVEQAAATVVAEEKKKHAILSPSSADRWMICQGSVGLSIGMPDNENAYSTEGTDYHEVAAVCLEENKDAIEFVGQPMLSGALVTADNAIHLQKYIDMVRAQHAAVGGTVLIEEVVPISQITGEEDAEGTSDAVILADGPELIVDDLKFGRGVAVSAEDNRQEKIYAIGVLDKHGLWEEYQTVRLVISQPRIDSVSEWCISIEALKAFKEEVRLAAQLPLQRLANPNLPPLPLVVSEKGCRFCKAKAICPELERQATGALGDPTAGFIDLTNPRNPKVEITATGDRLGQLMGKADLMELFIKAVRAHVEAELLAGRAVKDYKLVQGKKGNREWTNEDDVLKALKAFRIKQDEMYKKTLISPTAAETQFKKDHPKRWEKLQEYISQSDGAKSVAHISDKRPAWVLEKPEEGFSAIEDCSDLI